MIINKLEVESRLRLFQQLHQDDDPEWRRAAGACICPLCKLEYRKHPHDVAFDGYLNVDHRLCNGDIVHL